MNKVNLELKHYCKDFPSIRKVLRQLGAKQEVLKSQIDYFFPVPKKGARMKLRVEGHQQMLVYYERPDFTNRKHAVAEIKLYPVHDTSLLGFLVDTLGVLAIVKKNREVWRKEHTVFHLDRVQRVGGVFEIELQKTTHITASDRRLFQEYRRALLPKLGGIIKGSNLDLVLTSSK